MTTQILIIFYSLTKKFNDFNVEKCEENKHYYKHLQHNNVLSSSENKIL